MNQFYQLDKKSQWAITLLMTLVLLAIMLFWLYLLTIDITAYLFTFLFVPFFQFFATPIFTLTGVYQYLSPMLLVYNANDKTYDLHNGTSFDYFMVMRGTPAGLKLRHQILKYYLEGLLEVIKKIQAGDIPESVVVRGSSYFFSDNTAKRLGFKLTKPNIGEKFNFVLNYLDLIWMFSLAHGKFRLPRFSNFKTAEIQGQELVQNQAVLEKMLAFFNRNKQ